MSTEEKPVRSKRRWLRILGWAFLGLFLLLAVFHRPLIFEGTRYFVVRAAKQQNLDLTYDINGSIFSTLTVENLKAVPTESGPIQRLEVGRINLQYSLWGMIRHGLPALLQTVEVKDAFVELTPGEPVPPAKDQEPQQFKFPALFPEILRLENINFLSHNEDGDLVVAGFYFTLLPDQPGVFQLQALDIPGVRRWENLTAHTSFRDRNLLLTDLVVGPEISIHRLNLDASELEESKLSLALDGLLFGGQTTLKAHVSDLNASNNIQLEADCVGLSSQTLSDYLKLDLPVSTTLTQLSVKFAGEPEKPAQWSGRVNLRLDDMALSGQPLGALTFNTEIIDGKAKVTALAQVDERNSVQLEANATMPDRLEDFPKIAARGKLTLTAPALELITLQPTAGDALATVNFTLQDGHAMVDLTAESKEIRIDAATLADTKIRIHAEKDLQAEGPVFRSLRSTIDATLATVSFQEYVANDFIVSLASNEADVQVKKLALRKDDNGLDLTAHYILPEDLQSWLDQTGEATLHLKAPNLQAFAPEAQTLRGQVEIKGQASLRQKEINGDFLIDGHSIEAAGLKIRSARGNLTIQNNEARLPDFSIIIDDKNKVQAQGQVLLAAPYTYQGLVDVQLTDLSSFQSLLGPGEANQLAGSLVINWQGTGDTKHSGNARVSLTNGQFGPQKNLSASLNATYTPETISAPDIRINSDLAQLSLNLGWQQNQLTITNLAVRQQRLTLLSGEIMLPLVLSQIQDLNAMIPNDQPLRINLNTGNLDLRQVFTQLNVSPVPMTGMADLRVSAEGTLETLQGRVALRGNRLQSPSADQVAPADVTLDAELREKRINLNGVIRQPLIQPLRIAGNLPLDIVQIREKQAIDPNTPVNLEVRLPRSSLAFLSTLVPDIRQSRGTAVIDVRAGGTIAQPSLSGSIDLDLSVLRFTDPSLPPVDSFTGRINFAGNQITISRFRGGVAGGSVEAGGRITLEQMDNPVFDLRLSSRNALVLQNDDVTVRVTSDLRLTGPLNAASVTGTVGVTRSSFFKNIDILPIGLPGRPAPQPPAAPDVVSFRQPPLRDWKFDVAIRTIDPFRIQGNLANGEVTVDLKLGGTGLDPWLEGSVRIDRLTASLPFSRLNLQNSLVYFNRNQPFIPQLDIRGTSAIRDYQVTVTVYGSMLNPQALFTSDPPLPQSEIVTLIATGMTTSEFANNPDAIAGRAAILLFQKIYNSVFRRNRPPDEGNSFLQNVQLDLGVTDPKTGRQGTSVRIPLTNNIALIGGIDVGGNFRGQIKYLIRFQ